MPRYKVVVIYILIALSGATLSYFIYHSGQQIEKANNNLVIYSIPQLQKISLIRQKFVELERVLYEYYATTERETYLSNYHQISGTIETNLNSLAGLNDQTTLNKVKENFILLKQLSNQIDQTLMPAKVDWDEARDQLKAVTHLGERTMPLLDNLVADIKNHVELDKHKSTNTLAKMSSLVFIFTFVTILISIATGMQIRQYLLEAREKKRLALFVERNPNPVASMDWNGHLHYKNPSWTHYQQRLSEASLLPTDIDEHITRSKQDSITRLTWLHEIEGYCFLCILYKQEDVETFTIYLEDITQRKRTEQELEYLAYHDPLTGLPNRKKLETDSQRKLTLSDQKNIAILLIGIDRFNQVTASHGFKVGDQIIIAIIKKMQTVIESLHEHPVSITLYRFTEAKFVALLEPTEAENTTRITHQFVQLLQSEMNNFIAISHGHFYLNLSIGAAYGAEDTSDYNRLLRNADAAYSMAQGNGGNQFLTYNPNMMVNEQKWLTMEVDLRFGLHAEEFFLVYQPKMCAQQGTMRGVEALVRWQHNKQGFISPVEFIPVAENSGLIVELGAWILETACYQTRKWIESGEKEIICAVNISPLQFLHRNFLQSVEDILARTGLPPKHLELEITEGVLMNDIERSVTILEELHRIGVKLSIDDFGTGYSSLGYLKSFAIDKLKIDKSFIDNITTHKADKAIIRTIIDLAKHLDLVVIAEGVESQSQLELLRSYGCDEIQGYYYSKPLVPEDLEHFAQKQA
ncbi:bifunctional diguanylate cyclase/phosphodiesterase [Pleionea sp. CnH1-48]|uniref:putative bifunctional diguanylate cyclase/phosphodiesterase n=1 Tax=Pleionea sp. CnH1-48 TaxID=2954494 RepID=UPI002096A8C7|nr:bifunctional diguanylate cyclase/phosphodiesterase [Pleionea sp. CnH1-48]MCO7225629.1 bifunctional diguanylate cyclase/phosphodiesterase [Pleionea sp. CnH1-48]